MIKYLSFCLDEQSRWAVWQPPKGIRDGFMKNCIFVYVLFIFLPYAYQKRHRETDRKNISRGTQAVL